MSSLEIADFSVVAGAQDWLDEAVRIFRQTGFCIILNALSDERASEVLKGCQEAERKILELDPGATILATIALALPASLATCCITKHGHCC